MSDEGISSGLALEPQTWVEIDLGALRRNFTRSANCFAPDVQILLSVKKDAYGHGMLEVARVLVGEPRLCGFGVATVAEGLALRRAGIEKQILCFSVLRARDLESAIEHEITLTITDSEDARQADEAAQILRKIATAHLKLDTGMGRLGHLPDETLQSIPPILGLRHLKVESVYTHLADGWRDPESAQLQNQRMMDFIQACESLGMKNISSHIGGSDAISLSHLTRAGCVRFGIAIYGYHEAIKGLEPAMTFKSRVIYRRAAPAGTKISYGSTFTLQRASELALVGAGHGNGYPRILSNRGVVLIHEKRCRILGRVCMDQIVVDVTDVSDVKVHDEAVLFGRQGATPLSADEIAGLAETIPYELLCVAGQINPRVYPPQN